MQWTFFFENRECQLYSAPTLDVQSKYAAKFEHLLLAEKFYTKPTTEDLVNFTKIDVDTKVLKTVQSIMLTVQVTAKAKGSKLTTVLNMAH